MSYELFNPPRPVEQYVDRVPPEVIEELARCRLAKQPPKYLVKGEWIYADRRRYVDLAINREWVMAATSHAQVEGHLRWQCPGCGKLSGLHAKGCEYR